MSTLRADVPRSMMSTFVSAPIVLSPAGSTLLAMLRASEVARSAFAGDTAKMMVFCPCAHGAGGACVCIH